MNEKQKSKKSDVMLKFFLNPEIGIMIPILLVCVITTILKPNFLTWSYISSILAGSVFIGAATLGECLIIMSGEIDLSVGMNGCFAGIMMATAASEWKLPLVPCILVCLLTGAAVGLLNGFCVCHLGLSSWITTLATQFICQGLAVTVSQGAPISIMSLNTGAFIRAKPLGLSWLFFIFIALIVLLDILIRRTRYGFFLRSVGGNQDASVMAGLNARRIKLTAFVLAGLFAAVSGMFDTLNAGAMNAAFGGGREFRAIICCAVGGISMAGGAGSAFGVALGVLLFHTLWYCLRILDVNTNLQLVLIGLILVLSVIMDTQRKRIEARKMV
ncbi:MAG: ABC transporter permease [Lachnospiraceae bacterium]|jgi:ribose transport system permease protein|nr:ABC transporter permease [Lachnospiraceae bacterium]